jgi:uncharacterized Zn finger protein
MKIKKRKKNDRKAFWAKGRNVERIHGDELRRVAQENPARAQMLSAHGITTNQ